MKKVTVQRGQPLVKDTSTGSYLSLLEFLNKRAQAEFMSILSTMSREERTLAEVVLALIERQGALLQEKQNFLRDLPLLEAPFEDLADHHLEGQERDDSTQHLNCSLSQN